MKELTSLPPSLQALKKPPQQLFYRGDSRLLKRERVSIVGTRHPNQYTKEMTTRLAQGFAKLGIVVVSGAAMGVDALAHRGAFPHTIAVMANSLDIAYPAINKKLIHAMHEEALTLSEYAVSTRATKYSFVVRNRIVVALGEVLIITQADENSGTMRSAEIALEMGKKIYVLSHRVGESLGTQKLIARGEAEVITDIDAFIAEFTDVEQEQIDALAFFKDSPSLEESLAEFGDWIYELELEGKIIIKDLRVSLA
jgi:DNA processing protein